MYNREPILPIDLKCDPFNQDMFETVLWCTNVIRADINKTTRRNNENEKEKKIWSLTFILYKGEVGEKVPRNKRRNDRNVLSKSYLRMA